MKSSFRFKLATSLSIFLVWIGSGTIWLFTEGIKLPLDIDESGYFAFAIRNCKSFMEGGVGNFLHTVADRGTFAPLQPLLATPLACTGNVSYVILVPLIVSGLFLSYVAYHQKSGLLTVSILVLSPIFSGFAVNFQFAILSSTLFSLAVFEISRSQFFLYRKNVVFAAFAITLSLLSRTMFVAFFGVLVIVSLIYVLILRDQFKVRLKHFVVFISIPFLCAGTWYIAHYSTVFGYLTSFGYGKQADEYGKLSGILELDSWTFLLGILKAHYFTIFSIWISILLIILLVVTNIVDKIESKVLYTKKRFSTLISQHRTQLFYLLIAFGILVTLASTKNKVTTGLLPVFILLALILGEYEFEQKLTFEKWFSKFFSFLCLFLVLLASLVRFSPNQGTLSFRDTVIVDSSSPRYSYYADLGYGPKSSYPITKLTGEDWNNSNVILSQYLNNADCVVFAFRNPITNVNSVLYNSYKSSEPHTAAYQIEPTLLETKDDYINWIRSFEMNCRFWTSDSNFGQFQPAPKIEFLQSSLSSLNYSGIQIARLPDGSRIIEWSR